VIDSIAVQDDRVFAVYSTGPSVDLLRVVSSPEFAVLKESTAGSWKLGTGPMRLVASFPDADGIRVRMIGPMAYSELAMPIVRFEERSSAEGRDAVDAVPDLIVTRDPAVIDYATRGSGYEVVSGKWDRRYLLLSTSRAAAISGGSAVSRMGEAVLEDLARDAVRGEARPSASPYWRDDDVACVIPASDAPAGDLAGLVESGESLPRVVYPESDVAAAGLADRIVAIAGGAAGDSNGLDGAFPDLDAIGPSLRSEGVSSSDFVDRLKEGRDAMYIVSESSPPANPCYVAVELARRAPWLARLGRDLVHVPVALVETRPTYIGRRGRVSLTIDLHGRPRLIGRARAGQTAP
jgi:hypothetical protein